MVHDHVGAGGGGQAVLAAIAHAPQHLLAAGWEPEVGGGTTVGIRGQLMWFLCFICLLLLVLFWFLCTQLLEPLYTTHIQKQLTEQADAIVQKLDDAIADGQTLSYWGFGSQLYVNSQFFNQLSSEI